MRNLEISLPRRQDVEFVPDEGGTTQRKTVLQENPLAVAVPPENGTIVHPVLGKVSVRVTENPPRVEVEGESIGRFSEPIMQYPNEKQATKRYQASGETANGTRITVVTPEVHKWDSKNEIPVFVAPEPPTQSSPSRSSF